MADDESPGSDSAKAQPHAGSQLIDKEFKSWVVEQTIAFLSDVGVACNASSYNEFPDAKICEEVYPEMRVTEFYEGALAEANPTTEHRPNMEISRQLPRGWEVKLEDSFSEKDGEVPPDSVMFVGSAGSGKTTAMQRYLQAFHSSLNIILFGRNYPQEPADGISVYDFIFPDKSGISEASLRAGYEWMKAHPEKVNFFIDSLDTLPFNLSSEKLISKEEQGGLHSHANILSSILARKLFPGCKILSSSREYGITEFPEEIRADRIISFCGLSRESIRKFIFSVLDEKNGEEYCSTVEKRHPGLWALLSTPVFLIFALIGHLTGSASKFIPSTMSRVMIDLLLDLSRSEHVDRKVKINLRKLEELSYNGIIRGKVTFEEEDLDNVNLTAKEASALSIFVPWRCRKGTKLLQGKPRLFFCHQSIQELLAVLWILCFDFESFKEFINKHLRNPRFSVVRRFLAGVLLNNEVLEVAQQNDLLKSEDLERKQDFLKEFLKSELRARKKKLELLDLYITLSEAGGDIKEIIPEAIRCINLYALGCSVSDMHAIGFVVKHCNILRSLDVSECGLNHGKMEAFLCGLGDSDNDCKVEKFQLNDNDELGDGICELARILKKLKYADCVFLENCGLDAGQMQKFADSLSALEVQIKSLHLGISYQGHATSEITDATLGLISSIRKKLDMSGWTFDNDHCKLVKDELGSLLHKDPICNPVVICGRDGEIQLEAERLEDYVEEVLRTVRLLFLLDDMRAFARSGNGLRLLGNEVEDIKADHPKDARGEKLAYFEKWKKKCGRPTVSKLRGIVDAYCKQYTSDASEEQ